MKTAERERRRARIAEIAREIYHGRRGEHSACLGDCVTADIVKAVDDARRAEYYERLEEREHGVRVHGGDD